MNDMADLNQTDLNGLVRVAELKVAVGYTNEKEKSASVKGILPKTYKVVEAAAIAEMRTKKVGKNEGPYLTVESARAVLPPAYSAREIEGDVYAALRHPPTTEIRGYLPEEVETFTTRLSEYRAERERARLARAESRRALLDRFLAGDENVQLHFTDTAAVQAHDPTGANVVGTSQFGVREFSRKEAAHFVNPPAGVARFDVNEERWIEVN